MNNQEKIIKACIKGNRKAQKELYQMFSDKMYGVCLRYANDEDEAKDILQDGFIKVFITKKSTACGCDSCDLKDNTKDIRSLIKQKTSEQYS